MGPAPILPALQESAAPLDRGRAPQVRAPPQTPPPARGSELGVDARDPVGPPRLPMDRRDLHAQLIGPRPGRPRPLPPRIVSTGGTPSLAHLPAEPAQFLVPPWSGYRCAHWR